MLGSIVKHKLHYAGAAMMVISTSATMTSWQSILRSRRGGTRCALVAYFKYCHQNCNRELPDAPNSLVGVGGGTQPEGSRVPTPHLQLNIPTVDLLLSGIF